MVEKKDGGKKITTTFKRLVITALADAIAEEVVETVAQTPTSERDLRLGFTLREMERRIRSVWTVLPDQRQRLSLLYRLAPFIASITEEKIRENLNSEVYRVRTKFGFGGKAGWYNLELSIIISNMCSYEELIGPPDYHDESDD